MKTVTNFVLYADQGATFAASERYRPLTSVDEGDASGSLKVAHAASRCFASADSRGVPHPELICVRESRSADEGGRVNGRFVQVHPATLSPLKEGDKGGDELPALFKSLEKGK